MLYQSKSYLKTGGIISLVFFVLAFISIQFVDKPLTLSIHHYYFDQLYDLSYITEYEIPIFAGFCAILLLLIPTHKQVMPRLCFVLYFLVLLSLVELVRIKLGIICGRNWPLTWYGSGMYGSLVGDNHYAFHFFQSDWKGSFPSGHSMAITAICCTMYLIYNQLKYLWIMPVILMVTCLVLLNYHYLGDCLAGIGLSVFFSYYGFVLYLWLTRILFKRSIGVISTR